MEEKFDKKEYDRIYQKNRREKKQIKSFLVNLSLEEYTELNLMLQEANLTKADFLRNAIKDLKEKTK